MYGIFRYVLLTVFITIAVTACGGGDDNPPPDTGEYECTPDIPVDAGLFTSAPADIDDVADIVPLGSINPNRGNTIPVRHTYINYAEQVGGGSVIYPVYAMADGDLIFLYRERLSAIPDYNYILYIKHSCSVTVHYEHINELSSTIVNHLVSHNATWLDISGNDDGSGLMFLGQKNDIPALKMGSGQLVGNTKNYGEDWIIRLVDTRRKGGVFVNVNKNRYPSLTDQVQSIPLITADTSIYNLGNDSINSVCFIDYMADSPGLRDDWYSILAAHPQECGRVGWDTPQRLQGVWFNPVLDSVSDIPSIDDRKTAAFTIIPDAQASSSRTVIAWGLASQSSAHPEYALLDPANWTPPVHDVYQIEKGISVGINHNVDSTINPDPSNVTTGVTVCYDFEYSHPLANPNYGFNSILIYMPDKHTLRVKYDPTYYADAQCSSIMLANPMPNSSWVTYVR